MKNYLFLFALLSVSAIQAKDIRCVCNDNTMKRPQCGICGMEAGRMLLSGDGYGIDCMCSNGLKLKTVSCPLVCQEHEGWSGNFLVR